MQHSQVFLNRGNLDFVHSRRKKNHSLAPFDVIKLSRGLQDVFEFGQADYWAKSDAQNKSSTS